MMFPHVNFYIKNLLEYKTLVLPPAPIGYHLLKLCPFQENGKEDKERNQEGSEAEEPIQVEFSSRC